MQTDVADDERLQEVLRQYRDPAVRLRSLYWIVTKGDEEGEDALVVRFNPNRAQRRFLARMHERNIILKARQLGFSTLVAILWLDTALFSDDPIACAIIAQDRDTASKLFAKISFAYERLPPALKSAFPMKRCTTEEIEFGHNGASVRVATSARGGTIHRLHVSEMGKIGAKYPEKAREIVTGSIPAVPASGVAIIESTAEGQSGRFYEMVMAALAVQQTGRPLTRRDYRLHFFAWWEAPEYVMPPEGVELGPADLTYFNEVEARTGVQLSPEQRAWYVSTLRSADMANERPLMWQEYPSYPEEPFKVSTEGAYYTTQLADARKQGRILPRLPLETGVPVNTFWDIGANDNTAIWCHQRVGPENRFVRFYKNSGEAPSHYVQWLNSLGVVFGVHYLPHDAEARRLGSHPDRNESLREIFENLMPGQRFEIVPRVGHRLAGIQATRQALASCWFDETECSEGLRDLTLYRKEWDERRGTWKDQPFHGPESDAADAFRQFGQVLQAGGQFAQALARPRQPAPGQPRQGFVRRRGGPMAV